MAIRYYCFMRVYDSNIIGLWQHRETKRTYRFYETTVIVKDGDRTRVFYYKIETKNEESTLIFKETGKKFPFGVMTNTYFSVINKHGKFITLDRIPEQT